MPDVYERLAARLDELPHGFPATDTGVELRILRKIFAPDDAELALKLSPIPEPAEAIAQRLGQPVEEVRATLDAMAGRGQIGSRQVFGQQVYALAPFVVGIFEFQVDRMDAELARLIKQYGPTLLPQLGASEPALARVVPVNAAIEAQHQVLRYEDVRQMIETAQSFALRVCVCRRQRALEGHACKHTVETCLGFSNESGAFDYFNYSGRIISKDEALGVLDAAEQEGLVHCTYNVQHDHHWICNCCICCCGLLRGFKELKAPYIVAGANFVATINVDDCGGCGTCADERCPMDAIAQSNGAYEVLAERCIGCGVCVITCPTEAITLERRPSSECDTPPENLMTWMAARAASRHR